MATVASYYFDGSGGISDPDSFWEDEALAFNGGAADYGNSGAFMAPTATSLYLEGKGTTAPASGAPVSLVRVRVAGRVPSATPVIGTIGSVYLADGTLLGEAQGNPESNNYGDWVTLSEPNDGWDFLKVKNLYIRFHSGGVNSNNNFVYARSATLEVTSGDLGTAQGVQSITGISTITL